MLTRPQNNELALPIKTKNNPLNDATFNITTKKRRDREKALPVLRAAAAGIDIGAEEIYVAVPTDRDSQPVRRFATFTQDSNAYTGEQ